MRTPRYTSQGPERLGSRGRRVRARGASALGIVLVLATTLLSACGANANQTAAQQARAKLDADIHTAQTTYHVPPSLLDPITTREGQVVLGPNATDAQYAQAASTYKDLDAQLQTTEKMTPAQASAQAQQDVTTLTNLINNLQKQGFIEATTYAQREQQVTQQLKNASTTPEYFAVDTQVQQQVAVVQAFTTTYQQLDSLNTRVQTYEGSLTSATGAPAQPGPLACAQEASDQFWLQDTNYIATPQTSDKPNPAQAVTAAYKSWYSSDVKALRAAATPEDFTTLQGIIAAQQAQLTADQNLGAASLVSYLLQAYTTDVATYQQDGGTDPSFQQNLQLDQHAVANAQATARATLMQQLQKHIAAIQVPLLKVKTQADMAALKKLLAQAQAKTTVDPANGQRYPDAYEYADQGTGIGDPEARLASAQTTQDYEDVDREILMFSTNLTALLQNLNDPTAWNKPHKTDANLMKYYGTISGRVIVVSVRDQAARFYQDGQLVQSFQVTTGAPDLPSPVGIHCVLNKLEHTTFISPDPKGSPNWYAPTPINYAMEYSYYGYYLHDAWWRSWFGKYSNLPHWDPAAFNGGSHGCVNFALNNAAWVYNWASLGTPIIVY